MSRHEQLTSHTATVTNELPLEMHRASRLMRMLEQQSKRQEQSVLWELRAYRDSRIKFRAALMDKYNHWKDAQTMEGDGAGAPDGSASAEGTEQAEEQDADGEPDLTLASAVPAAPDTAPAEASAAPSLPEAGSDSSDPAAADPDKLARMQHIANAVSLTNSLISTAEEKFELARSLYQSIDRHVQILDNDLQKYENDLAGISIRPGSSKSGALQEAHELGDRSKVGAATLVTAGLLSEETDSPSRGRKRKAAVEPPVVPQPVKRGRVSARGARPGLAAGRKSGLANEIKPEEDSEIQLGVAPGEPTYCYCDRPSFGEVGVGDVWLSSRSATDRHVFTQMIGCDDDSCEREWFHYECVGIVGKMAERRGGKWYCQLCRPRKPSGEGAEIPSGPLKYDPRKKHPGVFAKFA